MNFVIIVGVIALFVAYPLQAIGGAILGVGWPLLGAAIMVYREKRKELKTE